MSEPRHKAERLAMLLEGRLPPAERERLLQEVADDSDAMADLGAAIAALRDTPALAATEGSASARADRSLTIPLAPPAAGWRRRRPMLAAAALVIVAVSGAGLWRATRAPSLQATFAAVAAVEARTMPDDWSTPPWARSRGSGTRTAHQGISAMLGARMADLALAERQSPERVPAIAAATVSLVRQVPGNGPAIARLEAALAGDGRPGRAEAAHEALEPVVDRAAYEFGAVLEGLRLALLAQDDAAVQALVPRLTRLAEGDALPAAARTEAARVSAMMTAETTTARSRDERLRAVEAAFLAIL